MGLDGVEIIMAVETDFALAIPDCDALDFITVGELVQYVYARLRKDMQRGCPSQQSFYALRKRLVHFYHYSRHEIKTTTKIATIFPEKNSKKEWRNFLEPLLDKKRHIPPCVRPLWLEKTVKYRAPVAIFCINIFLFMPKMGGVALYLAFLLTLGSSILLRILTKPFKTRIPHEFQELKDLIPFISTSCTKVWTEEEVFEKIRTIASEILGIDPFLITPEKRWIDDLGVG